MTHRPLGHADLDYSVPPRNGNTFRVPWVAVVTFMLSCLVLLGTAGWGGYASLDAKKADKEAVAAIQQDIRDLRNVLIGPPRRPGEPR